MRPHQAHDEAHHERTDQDRDRELLRDVKEPELYEAALTVMMRLVFLLSAEERKLMTETCRILAMPELRVVVHSRHSATRVTAPIWAERTGTKLQRRYPTTRVVLRSGPAERLVYQRIRAPVVSEQEKASLHRTKGALAVDMESHIAAAFMAAPLTSGLATQAAVAAVKAAVRAPMREYLRSAMDLVKAAAWSSASPPRAGTRNGAYLKSSPSPTAPSTCAPTSPRGPPPSSRRLPDHFTRAAPIPVECVSDAMTKPDAVQPERPTELPCPRCRAPPSRPCRSRR